MHIARAVARGVLMLVLVGGCAAAGPSGTAVTSPAAIATAVAAKPAAGPIVTQLPSGLDLGAMVDERLAFDDHDGAGVLNLDTGDLSRLPAPPEGLVFRPTGIAGNIISGETSGWLLSDPGAVRASAYDLAAGDWIDIAARLPPGDVSATFGTDGASVIGEDFGGPGATGKAKPFIYDVATGSLTDMAPMPDGELPFPLAIDGGHIVGGDGGTGPGEGFVYDQATGRYTMLADAAGTHAVTAAAIDGNTVVGTFRTKVGGLDRPFAYDIAAGTFTDLGPSKSLAVGVSGRLVIISASEGFTGWLRDLDSGAALSLAKLPDPATPGATISVDPRLISGRRIIGRVAPPTNQATTPFRVVVVDLGPGA